MSGTGASNLGYGNMNPYIIGKYVNATNSNNPANFSSNEIPGLPGLAGDKSNIAAAASQIPRGICLLKGGAKKLKKKIKNITKKYKMKSGKTRRIKSNLRRRYSFVAGGKRKRRVTKRNRSAKVYQKGGYSQYMNNLPLTRSYSLGGNLSPSNSALANPPPLKLNSVGGQCTDNYDHYTNRGFPSRGH